MRILGVGAHPDDLELMAGGTLRKYVEQGHHVVMCYMTNGDMGHAVIPPEELAEIRKKEAQKAAEIIGAEFEWVGIPDDNLFPDKETRMKLVHIIRRHQPDIIITHDAKDYHPDHRAAHQLVFDASFLATVPHIPSPEPHVKNGVPMIYCMEPLSGLGADPGDYVDITEQFDIKVKALSAHESQIVWMKEHDNIDFVEWMTTISEHRGLQCGCRFAEAFTQLKCWPRVAPKRVLP